jgi:hypothetical protein
MEARLKELDSKIEIKEDHNNADLAAFVELEELRIKAAKPATSLPEDVTKIKNLEVARDKAAGESVPKDVETINSQAETIKELNEALEIAESQNSGVVKFPTGKVDGVTYEVVIPRFSFQGKPRTAKEVSEDASLLSALVKLNSTAVRIVELKK